MRAEGRLKGASQRWHQSLNQEKGTIVPDSEQQAPNVEQQVPNLEQRIQRIEHYLRARHEQLKRLNLNPEEDNELKLLTVFGFDKTADVK